MHPAPQFRTTCHAHSPRNLPLRRRCLPDRTRFHRSNQPMEPQLLPQDPDWWSQRLSDPATVDVAHGEGDISCCRGRNPDPQLHHSHECRYCGTGLCTTGDIPPLGGRFASVFPRGQRHRGRLIAASLVWCGGLHENRWNAPAETRHLILPTAFRQQGPNFRLGRQGRGVLLRCNRRIRE